MSHNADAMAVLERSRFAHGCVNCGAVFDIRVFDEGEKATLPVVEFCPVCSLPHDRPWAEDGCEMRSCMYGGTNWRIRREGHDRI